MTPMSYFGTFGTPMDVPLAKAWVFQCFLFITEIFFFMSDFSDQYSLHDSS